MINITGAAEGRIAPIAARDNKRKKRPELDCGLHLQQGETTGGGPFFFYREETPYMYCLRTTEHSYAVRGQEQRRTYGKASASSAPSAEEEECTVIAPVTGADKEAPSEGESLTDSRLHHKDRRRSVSSRKRPEGFPLWATSGLS